MSGSKPWRKRWSVWIGVACAAFFGIGAIANGTAPETTEPTQPQASQSQVPVADKPVVAPTTAAPRTPSPRPAAPLLTVRDLKDGDSWVASDGTEYRLGLVNAPERSERCGPETAAFTRDFLRSGFRADAYATDTYGRTVAEVFDATGASLNVALAASGLGDDRYLDQFRHENPALARRLERAFGSAAVPACRKANTAPAPLVAQPKPPKTSKPQPSKSCMAGYSPCLPIVDDLDCGEIGHSVTVTGSDPYRLDRDGDGIGCD